jgi:murein DD-endopeptidase MepM/ murein hydrolase activator NlpD
MARYLTSGVVVLADDHPHAQGTIDTARAYAGHRYAVGHDPQARFDGFDDVVDPGEKQPTVAAAFKEAARLRVPWVIMRRDLASPEELLGALLQAAARRSSKNLPGFAVLLTSPDPTRIGRILAIVDRSDGPPSGLLALAAVAAAEATGAAVDVLVIGAPDEELDSTATPETVLRVARDKDLYEQAMRRSASLGARGNWMFVDHVDSRVQLVRDVLAAHEYDLIVDDLGNINLGGRMGRGKRIGKALREDGPASITLSVLKKSDLPVLLVIDAVRLGLVPAKVKAGAGASILALGIMASAAPKATASPAQRQQTQTSISQTVDDYDEALTAAANLATPADVEASHAHAQASGNQAVATVTGDEAPATDLAVTGQPVDQTQQADDQATDEVTQTEAQTSDESSQADDQSTNEQQGTDQADDQQTEDQQAADEEADATADQERTPADVSPSELSPEDVTPDKAPSVDSADIEVADDLSSSDVDDAANAADQSKEALDEVLQDFDDAQHAAIDAQQAAEDASSAAVEASSELDQAHANYEAAAATADEVIAAATGIRGGIPGGPSADDLASAEAREADAAARLRDATEDADQALRDYQEAATEAAQASADLDEASAAVTEAQAKYNRDKATAQATEDAYQEQRANARVSPVPEGAYTPTGHYGDPGSLWSTGYHTGEDYAAPVGTEVDAAASGTVVEVTYDDPAYGNRIVIEHENGYSTTYNHLSEIDVYEGQQVTAGDKIGAVGDTGNSTGPHLHFEVTRNGDGWSSGEFVNPNAWLAGDIG